jgi:hypothetical protein
MSAKGQKRTSRNLHFTQARSNVGFSENSPETVKAAARARVRG